MENALTLRKTGGILQMNRILAVALIAALALAATAVAAGKGAKTYRAKLAPVAAGATTPTGKAHLVDGKKNNFVTIHVKGLTSGTTYPWHVHKFLAGVTDPCAAGAAQGPIDTRFAYGTLTGNEDGNGSAKGKNNPANPERFNWGTDKYYVNVHDPATGTPISCGVLERKWPKNQPNGKAKGHAKQS